MVRFLPHVLRLCSLAAVAMMGGLAVAQQTVLLDFSIPGCAPCRQMDPIIGRLQQEGFPVRKVDGSREPHLAQRFGVQRYPTFVLISGGQVLHRSMGLHSYDQLRGLLVSAGAGPVPAPGAGASPSAIVPATFADSAPQTGAAFQVGSDLGPAPAVTIPGAKQAAAPRHQPALATAGPDPGRLLNSSVRLKVHDGGGNSFGTGTIIDSRQGEALVLTCAHLFRESSQQPNNQQPRPSAISVELFQAAGAAARVAERVDGQLISYDFDNDVALVSIRPRGAPTTARVATSPNAAAVGAPAWSVGCDRGADPTVRVGRVTTVDRYQSPVSVTVTGAPVVGRSGGGLFNASGELIGVCFGADEQGDEGFYAKLTSIHAELDKLGLSDIYRGGPPAAAAVAAAPAPAPSTTPPQTGHIPINPPADDGLVAVRPRAEAPPVIRGQDGFADPTRSLAGMSATERAAIEELTRRAAESEVVCVIRPREPGGKSEVIRLDRVSPQFLQALDAMRDGAARR